MLSFAAIFSTGANHLSPSRLCVILAEISTTSCRIGHINAGALMVADDLAIAANSAHDLQHGVSIAELDSRRQRYCFNVDKTKRLQAAY